MYAYFYRPIIVQEPTVEEPTACYSAGTCNQDERGGGAEWEMREGAERSP